MKPWSKMTEQIYLSFFLFLLTNEWLYRKKNAGVCTSLARASEGTIITHTSRNMPSSVNRTFTTRTFATCEESLLGWIPIDRLVIGNKNILLVQYGGLFIEGLKLLNDMCEGA